MVGLCVPRSSTLPRWEPIPLRKQTLGVRDSENFSAFANPMNTNLLQKQTHHGVQLQLWWR